MPDLIVMRQGARAGKDRRQEITEMVKVEVTGSGDGGKIEGADGRSTFEAVDDEWRRSLCRYSSP